MRIQNNVRSMLEDKLWHGNPPSANIWLFRIYVELHLQAHIFSATTVRGLFERAVISLR